MFLAQILIEGVVEEYLSCPLNFKTFENMSQKSWPNMYSSLFLNWGNPGRSEKITFFKNKILKLVLLFSRFICT